ncbi:MAG: MoaD/ThiS family protein [Candidatus Poseidoniales archaeon]
MENDIVTFQVLSFGPIVDTFGSRQSEHTVDANTTIRDFICSMGLEKWIGYGLSVAKNGDRCSMDEVIETGDEIALLPPMSGG